MVSKYVTQIAEWMEQCSGRNTYNELYPSRFSQSLSEHPSYILVVLAVIVGAPKVDPSRSRSHYQNTQART
jgi:hypothetical protein